MELRIFFYSGRYFLSNSSYCLPNVKQCRQNVFVEVANKCLTGKGAEKGVENFHRKHIGSRLANNPSKKKELTKNVHRVEHCSHPGEKFCFLAVLHKMIFTRTKSNRAQELSKAQTVLFCEGGKALHGRAKLRSFPLKKMCGRGDPYFLQYRYLKPTIGFLRFFSPLL